ncbi:hypothetical protein VKT23_018886 [Stygiomarasmius scandens]|uniref:Uncharacterized protein n=1 Tax=Marasmiellus scandens TaxID=2682957 RepID=A0ABR1IR80_9AGAR
MYFSILGTVAIGEPITATWIEPPTTVEKFGVGIPIDNDLNIVPSAIQTIEPAGARAGVITFPPVSATRFHLEGYFLNPTQTAPGPPLSTIGGSQDVFVVPKSSDSSSNSTLILAIVFGTMLAFIVIALILFWVIRRRKKSKNTAGRSFGEIDPEIAYQNSNRKRFSERSWKASSIGPLDSISQIDRQMPYQQSYLVPPMTIISSEGTETKVSAPSRLKSDLNATTVVWEDHEPKYGFSTARLAIPNTMVSSG